MLRLTYEHRMASIQIQRLIYLERKKIKATITTTTTTTTSLTHTHVGNMHHLELIIIDSMQFKSAHFNIQNTFFFSTSLTCVYLCIYRVHNESVIS